MAAPPADTAARMEVTAPKLLTPPAVLAISAYGLLLVVPVLVSILVVSVLNLSALTFAIPLLTLAAANFFLPFGSGNLAVARLVRLLPSPADDAPCAVPVQLTLTPRLRSGWRALLEDADDIGWLSFSGSALVFQGDSLKLRVPFAQIVRLRPKTIGWRGLFLYRPRLALTVSGLPDLNTLEFAERSSWVFPTALRNTHKLEAQLAARLQNRP